MGASEGEGRSWMLARLGLLCALLAPLLVLKLSYDPLPAGRARTDSTLYYLVARSVANGEGLRTPVSLYHQGLRDLPALSPIYPLWPLVVGWTGRLIGLERAASLLPELLYFVDLLLAYALGNRLAEELRRRAATGRRLPWVDLGHLAVLLLGANVLFFKYTSLCMTEGLAFCLLLAALLALPRAATRPLWAGVAGVLGGLSYLTRSQFVLVPAALALAAWSAGRNRAEGRRAALLAAAGALLVVLPWIAFLVALPGGFEPRMLVDFTAYRETPALPRFSGFVEHGSAWARLGDAFVGLGVAFDPRHAWSYVRSFGYALYLVPLALALRLLSARRAEPSAAARGPSLLVRGTVLTALASLVPVHLMRGNYPAEWYFGARHGLPMVLALLVAAGTLLTRGLALQLVALALVASTLWVNRPGELLHLGDQPQERSAGILPGEARLTAWLDSHERPPLVLATSCRELALWSSARCHWILCESTPEETRGLLQNLPIDYLIVYPGEVGCSFLRGLEPELELVQSFAHRSSRILVYRWRRP